MSLFTGAIDRVFGSRGKEAKGQDTILFFNKTKGFGFIRPQKGKDIFFYEAALKDAGVDTTEDLAGLKVASYRVVAEEADATGFQLTRAVDIKIAA